MVEVGMEAMHVKLLHILIAIKNELRGLAERRKPVCQYSLDFVEMGNISADEGDTRIQR